MSKLLITFFRLLMAADAHLSKDVVVGSLLLQGHIRARLPIRILWLVRVRVRAGVRPVVELGLLHGAWHRELTLELLRW